MVNGLLVLPSLLLTVFEAQAVFLQGVSSQMFGSLAIMVGLMVPVLASTHDQGRGPGLAGGRVVYAFLSVSATIIVFGVYGSRYPIVYLTLLVPLSSVVIVFLWGRRIQILVQTPAGHRLALCAGELHRVRFSWSATGGGLRAHLAEGDVVEGAEALRLAVQVLQYLNATIPAMPGLTDQAWALLRVTGDLNGLLGMLTGHHDEQGGRVNFRDLPPVYRQALDMALAGDGSLPDSLLAPGQMEMINAVAEEAEALDHEAMGKASIRKVP